LAQFIAVGLVALLGLVVVAPGASAAKNTKYCNAVQNLSSDDESDPDADEAVTLGKSFHKAANAAPSKVKSAMNTIGDYYESVGDAGSNPAKVAAALKNITAFSKAFAKWSKYTAKACLTIPE
jgi:hypothetical protein